MSEVNWDRRVIRPSSMEFLMHCYYTSAIHPEYDTPCMESAAGQLRELGLLKKGCKNTLTSKGLAYCNYILERPLPELMWVVNGEILDGKPEQESSQNATQSP